MGILVEVTGGGFCPSGGGGNGGAGISKSGGKAGTSVILGGPLLFIRVDSGRNGRPITGAVLACTLTFPLRSFTIPVMMSWISGLACRPFGVDVAIVAGSVAVGEISWGSFKDRP